MPASGDRAVFDTLTARSRPDPPERSDRTVRTSDGVAIAYSLWRRPSRELLIFAPGFWRVRLARENLVLAGHFLRRGYDVALLDFRGHGESGGAYTLGGLEREDLRAVARELAGAGSLYERFAVVGLSLGGSIAADALARPPDLPCRALVLISSPADVLSVRPRPWRTGALRQVHLRQAARPPRLTAPHVFKERSRTLEAISRLTIPKLIITAEGDWLVDPSHGRRLAQAAAPPVEHVHLDLPGSLHADALVKYTPRPLLRVLDRWLDANAPPEWDGGSPSNSIR